MVTSPTQAPMMPTVKVCAAGFDPASALKVSPLKEGVCIVHCGCTVSVIVIFCAAPTGWRVLSSTAEMLTVPVYVLADRPASAMPTCVAAESPLVTLPDAGVVVSQEPPEAVVTVAVQSSACLQAPVALMVTLCAAGFACPMTSEKVSAAGETETAQAAWTLKLTGICCGLPSAGCPDPSKPVIVIVCGSGPGWPTTASNDSVAGVAVRLGAAGGPIISVTGKVCVPGAALKIIAPVYVPGVRPVTLTPTDG